MYAILWVITFLPGNVMTFVRLCHENAWNSKICPIISTYHTRSFAHIWVSCIRTRTPISHPATPPRSGSYCVKFSTNICLLWASCEIPVKVDISFSYFDSWYHHLPPPCVHHLRRPSPLYTIRIVFVMPPTVPHLPAISLYRSFTIVFPLLRHYFHPRRLLCPVS